MNLTPEQAEKIVTIAQSHLGTAYGPGFKCIDFVRLVYKSVGIYIPPVVCDVPPADFNITTEQLSNPPIGSIIFLLNKKEKRERNWSHVAIVLPNKLCIHCSLFKGGVIISSLEEIFQKYNFAPSPS